MLLLPRVVSEPSDGFSSKLIPVYRTFQSETDSVILMPFQKSRWKGLNETEHRKCLSTSQHSLPQAGKADFLLYIFRLITALPHTYLPFRP